MNNFNIDPNLLANSINICDMKISKLLLMNNKNFPWLILVPMLENKKELIDLDISDQIKLLEEINIISGLMQEIFAPEKINIASLGNITPQLHVHITARFKNDIAWPRAVYGSRSVKYSANEINQLIIKIISYLDKQEQTTI